MHLDHRERLQVHLRKALLQAANQVEVIIERKIGMQPADDVKFRGAFGHALRGARVNFIERKRVGARRIRRAAERAQLAVRDANVRGIDVPVDVEVADVSVALLAHVIRKPADGQQVVRLEEREAVFGVRRSPARTFCAMGSSRASSRVCRFPLISRSRFCAALTGRHTDVAAPQNSRNNKLI